MSLAFRCKDCGRKYRNVSPELSGRRVRCQCGRTQRLMTKAAKRALEKVRQQMEQGPKFEVLIKAGPNFRDPPNEVFDLQSQSVVVDAKAPLQTWENWKQDQVDLVRDRKSNSDTQGDVSTLPSLPRGYIRKAYRLSPASRFRTRFLNYLGVLGGTTASVLGAIICFLGVQMILAGAQGESFVDPVVDISPRLVSHAGVRITGVALFVLSAGLVVAGVSQLTGCLLELAENKSAPQWPDGMASLFAMLLVVAIALAISALWQSSNRRLELRSAQTNRLIEKARENPGATTQQFVAQQEQQLRDVENAVKQAQWKMILKTLPIVIMTLGVGVIALIRYRSYQESCEFGISK